MEILNQILDAFGNLLMAGLTALRPDVLYLGRYFLIILILFYGAGIAFGKFEGAPDALRRLILIGLVLYLIDNWGVLAGIIRNSAYALGLKFSGSAFSSYIRNPSTIMDVGLVYANDVLSIDTDMFAIGDQIMYNLIASAIFVTFLVIALVVFMIEVQFLFFIAISFLFLPFFLFKPLRYLAHSAIGGMLKFAVYFFALTVVIGMVETFITSGVIDAANTNFIVQFRNLTILILFAVLSYLVPRTVAGLFYGHPSLNFGTVAATGSRGARAMAAPVGVTVTRGGEALTLIRNQLAKRRAQQEMGSSHREYSQNNAIHHHNTRNVSSIHGAPSTPTGAAHAPSNPPQGAGGATYGTTAVSRQASRESGAKGVGALPRRKRTDLTPSSATPSAIATPHDARDRVRHSSDPPADPAGPYQPPKRDTKRR